MERIKFRYSIINTFGTILYIIVIVGVGYLISALSLGSYITAWYTTMIGCLTLLHLLTLPRYISLKSSSIEIRCLLKVVEIEHASITKIKKVSPRELHFAIPISLWFGFMGSVGLFFIPKELKFARVYITNPRHLLKIETDKGRIYYISCPQRDRVINSIEHLSLKKDKKDLVE